MPTSIAQSSLLLVSPEYSSHEPFSPLQSPGGSNLADTVCSVIGILSKLPVIPNDVTQIAIVAMTAVDQEPGELRVHKAVSPLSAARRERHPFELERMNPGLK